MNIRSTKFAATGPPGPTHESDMLASDDESSRDSGICLMEEGSPTCFSALHSNYNERKSYSVQNYENAMEVEVDENAAVPSPPKRKKRTLRREKTCHVRLFDESPNSHTMFARPALTMRTNQNIFNIRKRSLDLATGEYLPEKRERPPHASDHFHLESMDGNDDDSPIDMEVQEIRTVCAQQSTSTATGRAKFTWQRFHSTAVMQTEMENIEEREDKSHLVVNYNLKTISTSCSSTYRRISAETLCDLIHNASQNDFYEKYILVDCRYPFEFEGGHITNSINFYDRDKVSSLFFDHNGKRKINKIPIFYCEFSQKRGPSMASALREDDRKFNHEIYPNCSYEEMYVLDKGFRNFFRLATETNSTALCEPFNYVEMSDPQYVNELKVWNYHRRAGAGQTVMRTDFRSQESFFVSALRTSGSAQIQPSTQAAVTSENTEKTTPASRKESSAHCRVLFQGNTTSPTSFPRMIPQDYNSPPPQPDDRIPLLHFGDFS